MRNVKRFLSLVVAALLTVSAVATSASAAKFTDVDASNEALNDAVELLVALGVTKGTTETTFGTDENVTREQMAAFVYRMMKAGKSVEGGTNVTSFTDLEDETFFFMISWANSQGIIKGRSATTFDPKGGIILQDAYTMLVRALGYDDGTLTYPIDHINLAEELGLDKDLPSTLNYTDTLTRGNLAIILANMFYAKTAETEIRYETVIDRWETSPNGNEEYPVTVQKPVEYQKTIAEAVFKVEKASVRVVATPNYSFAGAVSPDEDVEMIVLQSGLAVDEEDYIELNEDDAFEVEFAELGLDGAADDYFLSDILMFVKVDGDDIEIYGATAQGEKKTVSFDDIEFGTVSGTKPENYYDGENKEIKKFNGLLTIDGVKTYIFDVPYSYTKTTNYADYAAKFITLADGDFDKEEDTFFMNYAEDTTVAYNNEIVGTFTDNGTADEPAWANNADGYLSQMYLGGLGEVDVYDCNGDGKYEYIFVKNYTVGVIDTEEDGVLAVEDDTVAADEVVIYTDGVIVEGVEYADEDVVLAYINNDAEYVKVAEVLNAVEAEVTTAATKYYGLSTGEKIYYEYADKVVTNGAANGIETSMADVAVSAEGTFYFAANGTLVYVADLAEGLNLNTNWTVVLADEAIQSVSMVDGKLEKAYYIDVYNDGEIKSVKARAIVDEDDKYFEEDVTPVTTDKYDYSDYINKLAVGKSDKNGAYYFELLVEGEYDDDEVLEGADEAAEYRALGEKNVTFYQKGGYRYVLDDRTVYIKPYTQIIIRSYDEEAAEDIVTVYGYDNLPNINETTEFAIADYVLVNNTASKSYENLAVFYGYTGEKKELEGAKGEAEEIRIVTSYTAVTTEDGTVYTYDTLNPFTGAVEAGLEGVADSISGVTVGSIYALTTENFIDDETAAFGNAFTAGTYYDVDDSTPAGLGFVKVVGFDAASGYLEVVNADDSAIGYEFIVDEETVVSFADKSEGGIKVVDASALASTTGTYRTDKKSEKQGGLLQAFLCVEESDDFDEDETYIVKFAMIVRN